VWKLLETDQDDGFVRIYSKYKNNDVALRVHKHDLVDVSSLHALSEMLYLKLTGF
jgi:hypothetical protein